LEKNKKKARDGERTAREGKVRREGILRNIWVNKSREKNLRKRDFFQGTGGKKRADNRLKANAGCW